MNKMKRKTNNIPDINYIPVDPEVLKKNTAEETAAEVLTAIRQHEPEEQNNIVATLLKEIAIDRQNSVQQYNNARDRACKNHDEFMMFALGLEKILAQEPARR